MADMRHQLEEELRQRCSDLEGQQQDTLSKSRACLAAVEDTQRRHGFAMSRVEGTIQELLGRAEEHGLRLGSLEASAALAAQASAPRARLALEPAEPPAGDQLWRLEQTAADLHQRLEQLRDDARSDRAACNALAEQVTEHETRIVGCRAYVDSHQGTLASLDDRIRQVCERQLVQPLSKSVRELARKHLEAQERSEATRMALDQVHEVVSSFQRQVFTSPSTRSAMTPAQYSQSQQIEHFREQPTEVDVVAAEPRRSSSPPKARLDAGIDAATPPPRLQALRSSGCESSPGASGPSLAQSPAAPTSPKETFGPLIMELLNKLKDIAPKVIEHERFIELVRANGQLAVTKEDLEALRDEMRGFRCRMVEVEQSIENIRTV
ncbi:unnamed protein product [Prorocentrum cordatum]|uniref:Uncharacterized protein n=1 Tax=Prorocentrum cordatum TaxID=2364126 RepID=A0ABN9S5B2_9DINO|nr:unnamed protein product [Polarella glacialis]